LTQTSPCEEGNELHPALKTTFDKGADRFINKGLSGRWRQYLNAEDVSRYEAIVRRAASPGLTHWLAGGRKSAGDPQASAD
jgi:hypothetical protein